MTEREAYTFKGTTGRVGYDVTALQMPIYYNEIRLDTVGAGKGESAGVEIVGGDHDHSGLIYALTDNVPLLKYIRALIQDENPSEWKEAARRRAEDLQLPFPTTKKEASRPHPIVRPLVLRGRYKEPLSICFCNEIPGRHVGMHLVAAGYDVKTSDGSDVGLNPSSLAAPGQQIAYLWMCEDEGVFVFHDGGNYDGSKPSDDEDGHAVNDDARYSTNLRGLFGALCVEPQGAIWRDPVTGRMGALPGRPFVQMDGLYMDILYEKDLQRSVPEAPVFGPGHQWPEPREYYEFDKEAHREFVIVFHDEPEFVPPHHDPAPDPCHGCEDHGGHGMHLPLMPISYRAEPMVNREHELMRLMCAGHDFGGRPVLNEEQHHSSWMFGDPATPILKAYVGDPVRIRLVHTGVKETHVFHLHLYEWHAAPQDRRSPRIDAISFSPQTGHTIEPVWGAGNRHQVAGDVIWHCHLYPHFHEGMWGMFRTFETLQDGEDGPHLDSADRVYGARRIGRYPDGTRIERLLPLPGRPLPPRPTSQHPGFPLYIPGINRQKAPIPPWPDRDYEAGDGEEPWCDLPSLFARDMPAEYNYRPVPTGLERGAFNPRPLPGELFTRRPFRVGQAEQLNDQIFSNNGPRELCHPVGVTNAPTIYNDNGWIDLKGHFYFLQQDGKPDKSPRPREPLFFRAQHGQILNLPLSNELDSGFKEDAFDHALPPCDARPWQGECALHVHMVKFDPICGDGASTGWNYMSGPVLGKQMAYRWWLDQEFGTIFFHDHMFANYRQKRGLFGALIVEPPGSTFLSNTEDKAIVSGLQARIILPQSDFFRAGGVSSVREFCMALADFIPLYDGDRPLNPPDEPGGHGDQGVMAINYRNAPILLRDGDPAFWFSSFRHGPPDTTRFATHADDPIWFRLIQGSHEEQHSFQVHGMRWRRFRVNTSSELRNQQTFGIAEAFTFVHDEPYGPGDYLYKLSSADDLWLGCWGLIRALPRPGQRRDALREKLLDSPSDEQSGAPERAESPDAAWETDFGDPAPLPSTPRGGIPLTGAVRRFAVEAVTRRLVYREGEDKGEPDVVDPFGLIYRVIGVAEPGGAMQRVEPSDPAEPLVIRCRHGEELEVTLYNRIDRDLDVEPHAPEVPLEKRNRPVSQRVSMHADLMLYDVRSSDGSAVGHNPVQTARPGYKITYRWRAMGSAGGDGPQPLGPAMLQDMADFRNHRHHGLVGALIIEPKDAVPRAVLPGEATARSGAPPAWHGARATVSTGGNLIEEMVLFMQDGLRLYEDGETDAPLPDEPGDEPNDRPDYEDQGQKGFSYRTEPRGRFDVKDRPPSPPQEWLNDPEPATPLWHVHAGSKVHLHLIGACDKPRNHSFTVHGVAWPEWRFPQHVERYDVSSESAVTTSTARSFRFVPQHEGDHAYRSGVLRWDVAQGLWGIMRVLPRSETATRLAQARALRGNQPASVVRTAVWGAVGLALGWVVLRGLRGAWRRRR
jgi:hypothetical protein